MLHRSSKLWAALVFAIAAPMASAQGTILVDPEPLVAGSTVTIGFSDPSRAGETVVIEITGITLPDLELVEVEIRLDERGEGKIDWEVPDWWAANFNAKGATEVTREIVG